MQVSTNDGGTKEFALAPYNTAGGLFYQYHHFQVLSNDLIHPKIVYCPSDKGRLLADNFQNLSDLNLSYFVGANAEYNFPNSILAGDRNITNNSQGASTVVRLDNGSQVSWTAELHKFKGNILFADSHVSELNAVGLQLASQGAPTTVDMLLPSINTLPPGASGGSYSTVNSQPRYSPPTYSYSQPSSSPRYPSAAPPPGMAQPMPPPATPANLSMSHWSIPLSTPASAPAPAPAPQPAAMVSTPTPKPPPVVRTITNTVTNTEDAEPAPPEVIIVNPAPMVAGVMGHTPSFWLWILSLLLIAIAMALRTLKRKGLVAKKAGA
jgi:prepilin-type processing-associated H-X9-DG protein